MKDMEFLKKSIEALGLNINEQQLNQFEIYYDLLIEWNQKINLTAITEWQEVVTKHFVDSLMVVKVYELSDINTLIDVGTGAGFPSIPIKIMFPHIEMTLLDSLNKRIKFLDIVCRELKLNNMDLVHGRAEDYGKDMDYREQFDISISRAVSQLSPLSEYCIPFIKPEGFFIAYKALDSDEEIESARNAIKTLGGEIENVYEEEVPNTILKRKYVMIKKIEITNLKYPRTPKKISKKPL